MKKYAFISLCLVLSTMLSAFAVDDIKERTQELQNLKQNKDKLERERKTVIAKEKNVLEETKKIDKELISKEKELRKYNLNLTQCEREIEILTKELANAEARAKETQEIMLSRLKSMYKLGYDGNQVSYLTLLVGSESISDLMNKHKYMSAIAKGDKMLLEKASAERAEIAQKKKQMEARKEQLIYYKQGTEKIKNEISKKGVIRRNTLSELQKSKTELTKTIKKLEQDVRDLESLIVQLLNKDRKDEVFPDADDLGKLQGRLPWPTSGRIIENVSPVMKGVTIQANYGSDIRTIADGIVEYSQWFEGVGFGQMIIINHGKDYRTLYAHVSELLVKKGDTVSKGQVIARVGSTGSFKGPVLYFEIWRGKQAMHTRQWLRN